MRGRFAPSPSGDLHLGGARTALAAWLDVRVAAGTYVLRVEDLDGPRTVAGAEARILEDLRWLGLGWDEGPFRQSERQALYAEAVERLLAEGRAFECFCSRAEVQRASQAPHGPSDDGPRYPGTCRELTAAERATRRKSRAPSVRLRVEPGAIAWTDRVHGPREDDVSAQVGDFVLRRADGIFAYQLAVVADDAAMRITGVVRGDDLLTSTARQLLLYDALGLRAPAFAHVPLVLGPDGARLSKRHGAISVRDLRDRGRTAEEVIALLASTLGLCAPDDRPTLAELTARFDLARLTRTPTTIDPSRT